MDVENLAKELILKNMTPEQQTAVLDSIKESVAKAKEVQKRKIGENVDLVVQALKKIEDDIRSRYDDIGNTIEKRVASIKDGRDGIDGRDGKDGKDGRQGKDGRPGFNGKDGKNGLDGADGQDGISVVNAHIDFDGSLVIHLSSGKEINVGEVVAPDLAEKIKVITNGGGTSQTVLDTLASLQAQIDALIPSQTGNSGKFLTTNGSTLSWASVAGGLSYQGTWNADTNTPTLASGVGTNGYYYVVATAGSTNLDGITDWQIGDWLMFNGTVWQKIDQSNLVTSVNGQTGAVSLTTTNINEGTNLYYLDSRARQSLSAGTGISYSTSTGVITNSSPDQVVSLTGAGTTSISGTYPSFTITSNDQYQGTVTSVTGTSPIVSSGGTTPAISIPQATSSVNGYLSSTDWTTFNNKGSGTVTSVGQSFTGGLISVSGSPITSSGTLALTVAGTSGGIPYFSSASAWASSSALAANSLVIGGGAGAAPSTITTGTNVLTALGVNVGTAGAFVVNGGALGTPSSGTVTNLTGTASININGTVGATTPTTGAFTTVSASGVATFSAGSAAAPAITTSGDTNNGIFFPAADVTAITTAGSERVRVDSSGNVNIGVTGGNGLVNIAAPSNGIALQINGRSSDNTGSVFFYANDGATQYGKVDLTASEFRDTAVTGVRTFYVNGSERMRIDTSGNVGIGTSSPLTKLSIGDATSFSPATMLAATFSTDTGGGLVAGFRKSNTGANAVNVGFFKSRGTAASPTATTTGDGSMSLISYAYDGSTYGQIASISSLVESAVSSSSTPGYLTFNTTPSGSSTATERIRIDSSGNVGIGTSSPAARLHSYATSGTTTTLGRFEAAIGSYTGTSLIAANTLGDSSTYNLFSCLTDSDGDAGGPNTKFLVRGDGNVGIGTSSPISTAKASIKQVASSGTGSTQLHLEQYNTTDGYDLKCDAADGDLAFLRYASGSATERMRISASGIVTMSAYGAGAATFSSSGVISSVSDETWKIKDGVPTNPTEMLKKLSPGYWYYNDEKKETYGKDRQLGFYAQNVNAAIGPEAAPVPESVNVTDENGEEKTVQKPWGYYDRSVLAVVVMALQELRAEFDAYKAAHP